MITSEVYDHAHSGDVTRVAQWLEKNPDSLNTPVSDGFNALHVACLFGHEPLVRHLVSRGALVNIDADNDSRATPLHLAVSFRDEKIAASIAQYLIDHGAELNAMQKGGQTPLHHAVARGSTLLVDLLIEAGGDPFLADDQGRSPADLARELSPEMHSDEIRATLKKAFALSPSVEITSP